MMALDDRTRHAYRVTPTMRSDIDDVQTLSPSKAIIAVDGETVNKRGVWTEPMASHVI